MFFNRNDERLHRFIRESAGRNECVNFIHCQIWQTDFFLNKEKKLSR